MKILKQVIGKRVPSGGDAHVGWLPLNAAIPRTTPLEHASVNVRILQADGGFIVEWESHNFPSNDSWHATMDEAQEFAQDQFGIEAAEWEVPGDIGERKE